MTDLFATTLHTLGVVPVVKLDNAHAAGKLAQALLDGGLPCMEITFRTDAAAAAIRAVTQQFPEMLVGAGTVLTMEQLDCALDAGAKFIVAPGFNPAIVTACTTRDVPVIPGCVTPTEIETALAHGIRTVKFFPAEAFGGLATLKALSAAYGDVRFMPTGGIGAHNLAEYLAFPKVVACGGSWMVSDALVRFGRFAEVTRLTREAVAIVKARPQ